MGFEGAPAASNHNRARPGTVEGSHATKAFLQVFGRKRITLISNCRWPLLPSSTSDRCFSCGDSRLSAAKAAEFVLTPPSSNSHGGLGDLFRATMNEQTGVGRQYHWQVLLGQVRPLAAVHAEDDGRLHALRRRPPQELAQPRAYELAFTDSWADCPQPVGRDLAMTTVGSCWTQKPETCRATGPQPWTYRRRRCRQPSRGPR